MSWSEQDEQDEYERHREAQAYEERRAEADQMHAYYEHYWSLDGWIDRLHDEILKRYGKGKAV